MRFLANENIPGDAVELLRSRGHDVLWVRTESPGASDEANLALAVSQQRVLITFDKDFGNLVFHLGRAASCGIVLFPVETRSSAAAAKRIVEVLESRADWPAHFSAVEDVRIRMVPLPANPKPR
ncbi:MAG: hypothetical protein A2V70_17615 [Planctomycetes bacterium RBG_13_63_9]|nr:MAG: hypothetical protein A2V70_17615 [Planctomycetes bacterium RBG_13_63_9]